MVRFTNRLYHGVASARHYFFAGVFFAITMNTANNRRFQALDEIALLKATFLSIWHTAQIYLDENNSPQSKRTVRLGHSEFLSTPYYLFRFLSWRQSLPHLVILVVLIRIQMALENPFGDDMDDVSFKFLDRIKKRIS